MFSLSDLSCDPPSNSFRMLALQFSLETRTRTEPSLLPAVSDGGGEILFRLRESKFCLVSRTGCCPPLFVMCVESVAGSGFSCSLHYVTLF
jgi:hypothetical protein